MSDNRRRRKSQQSGGSDDLSDSYEELNATKETQSSEHTEDHHDPAYDAGNESNSESQDSFQDGEYNKRESGDGQEEDKPQKKLDDDEDRRNPQYIPKRGTFYEHDDRTAEEANDETVEPQPEREAKEKKVWKDKEDRWDHDRYNDEEQAPKSHAELIAVYGYDIRNEEGPPRARRRRKYGRGPNKYTRNWEDEDAYGKVAGTVPTNKPNNTRKVNRTGEEFPLLNPKDKDDSPKTEEQPVITSAWYSNKNKIHPNKTQNFPPLQTESQKAKPKLFTNSQANENKPPNERNNTAWKREPKNTPYIQNANTTVATVDTEKIVIVKTAPRENKRPTQVQESVSLASSKSRGRGFKANANNNIVGNRTIESKPKGRGPGPLSIPVDNRRSNVEHEQIINDMKHMNVSTEGPSYHHAARQNKHFYTQPSSQHSTVVPPRMQPSHPQQQPPPPQQPPQPQQPPPQQDIASNRPKRYSSLRQRPLIADGPPTPTQPNYQPAPQHTYYPPPQGYPPGPYEQTPAPAAPMGGQPVIPIPPGAQPASYAPHAPPPFLVPTPQFIPSQTAPPSIINYVAGPNGPIFQPNYQGYNPAAVQPGPPPPQEVGLYQPQGCTYYSPAQQQQQQQQQPVPLRRPKAAIPILPPPDNLQNPNNRGRPRSLQPQSQMPPQDPQQQQQLQQQQQQEQLVQQQLQQHQQQLIQEQQQERQQQEQLLQQQQQQKQQELQQQQQKQQELQQQQQKQQELQQQQQKKQQEQQKQQQQEQPQKQLKQEQPQQPPKQEQPQQPLKQEQPQQPPKQEQPQQPLKQEQPQQSQQPEQKQIPESEQHQKPEQEQKQVPEQEQHVEKPEELKQEPQQEQSQEPQQEQPQKLQQEQQQEPLKKEQQEPQQKEQEKPQVQDDSNSDKSVSKPVETLETTIKTVDKIESFVNDDSSVLANTKDNLEQKLESIVLEDKSLKGSEEKILEPVVTEAAVEQKETLTKVEVVIPDVIPNAVEEKITAPAVTEVSLVMTTVLEEKTDKSVSNCVIESNAILASEEVKGVSTNTAELVSSKSETDCSIKERAVIEEAAA